jgi:hypothetical protein
MVDLRYQNSRIGAPIGDGDNERLFDGMQPKTPQARRNRAWAQVSFCETILSEYGAPACLSQLQTVDTLYHFD